METPHQRAPSDLLKRETPAKLGSERDAASSAAWSAAGARLAELAQREGNSTYNGIRCFDCVLGGHNKFSSRFYRHVFNWKQPALTKAGEARNTYFEILA